MMQTEMVLRKPWLKMDTNQFKKRGDLNDGT